jgi:DNA-binding SARP family transcriptional activator
MEAEMRFSVLGVVSVTDGVNTVVLPPSKPTSLLAALLLRPNEVLSVEFLQSAIWESAPPPTAKATLQTYVLRLRRLFREFGISANAVETVPGGYRFPATAATLDLVEFRELVQEAASTLSPAAELETLRRALKLWQGPPLSNIASSGLQRDEIPCLVEEWLRAAERRFDLELELGRHRELPAELRAATRDHPGYERFWEQLIEALYRSGRQADALAEYGNVKRFLRDELAIDPGLGLQKLELSILRSEALAPLATVAEGGNSSAALSPKVLEVDGNRGHLPPDLPHFTGRQTEVDALIRQLSAERSGPLVVVISGPPGIGKTALAVHVAHAIRSQFPDSQRYLQMTSQDRTSRDPASLAEELSRGVAGGIFGSSDRGTQKSASDRTLLLLDDAVSLEQVLPLLTARDGGAVIVTSRASLSGLAARRGGVMVRLGALEPEDSVRLLTRMLGEREQITPSALWGIAEGCSHFPAALCVAASRLTLGHPSAVDAYVEQLHADPIGRLSMAADRAMSMFHLFDEYVSSLAPSVVEAFRALAQAPTGELSVADCSLLVPLYSVGTERLLEELVDASLLEIGPGGGYCMYPLLRHFAEAQIESDLAAVRAV